MSTVPNEGSPKSNIAPTTASQWLGKVALVWSHLRFQPFELSTEEGRASERHRRILLTALSAAGAKAVGALTAFISIPLTTGYLDAESYGLWITLSASIVMLSFADMGLGNGLLNRIAEANAKGDRELAKSGVSSAFFMLTAIGAGLLLLFLAVEGKINWEELLNITSPKASAEVRPAMEVLAVCFALNLPLGIVNRVQLGNQEGFVNSLWTGAGNLLSLAGILVAVYFHAGLPWLVAALAGAPVLALFLNGCVLFFVQRPWLRPRWRDVSGQAIRVMMRLGSMFFIISITISLTYTMDNFIAAHKLDLKAAADYGVVATLFGLAPKILEMFFTPLWPAYREAVARGDVGWVRKMLSRSLKWGLMLAGAMAAVFVIFGGQIISVLSHNTIHPPFMLLLGSGCWSLLYVWGAAAAMFLNGTGTIKAQAVCGVIVAVVSFSAKILVAKRFGLPGIIWAMVISYSVFIFIPINILIPRILAGLKDANRDHRDSKARARAPEKPEDYGVA